MPAKLAAHLDACAVCISRNPESWEISDLPFYDYTDGWKPFKHEKTKERVDYLARRRNLAVAEALRLFPEIEHILMIDSYYLQQKDQIYRLVQSYANLSASTYPEGCILGASTWIHDLTRVVGRYRFYDGWTTPEGIKLGLRKVEKSGGLLRVNAVGGCYLYPKWVWEKIQYGTPEDLHGCEHNWLCENSNLPVFLSLDVRLWREALQYSWMKRLRMSMHLGRLLGR